MYLGCHYSAYYTTLVLKVQEEEVLEPRKCHGIEATQQKVGF